MATDASSSTWVNTIPAATQVVPSIGLDGQPTTSPSPSEDNGGDTFPTAAAVVIAIIAAVVVLFAGYKLYKWSHRWRASANESEPLPEARGFSAPRSPAGGAFVSLPSQMSMAFNGGNGGGGMDSMGRRSNSGFGSMARSRQASWGGDSWGGGYGYGEKGDLTPSPPFGGTPLPPGTPTSREGSPGPHGGANDSRGSLANFPSSGTLPPSSTRNSLGPTVPRRSYYSSSASGPQLLHSRTASSFSSSPLLGSTSGGGGGISQFPSGNRLAGAPHNPHSRIEVVPPLPLAPPPGTVIATDKSTLDFAPSSGIGKDGQAQGAEEWLNIVEAAGKHGGAGDVQERLNPAFDGAYHTTVSHSAYPHPHHQQQQPHYPPHSFPPPAPASSSGGSSRSSAAPAPAPGQRGTTGGRRSVPNLRGAPSNPALAAVARQQHPHPPPHASSSTASSASVSANSSDSNLSSSGSYSHSAGPRGARAGAASAARPPIAVNTALARSAAAVDVGGVGADEPRSPLEKLQREMERQAGERGLRLPVQGRGVGGQEGER
ncbi:hypothetical protein JCM6882_003227 [Rhodosporidiobolus microsporus]